MIKIEEQKIVALEQMIGDPHIYITGESSLNTRQLHIVFNVYNEKGEIIDTKERTYKLAAFNRVYAKYTSDKFLAYLVLKDIDKAEIDKLPDNAENPAQEGDIPASEITS